MITLKHICSNNTACLITNSSFKFNLSDALFLHFLLAKLIAKHIFKQPAFDTFTCLLSIKTCRSLVKKSCTDQGLI